MLELLQQGNDLLAAGQVAAAEDLLEAKLAYIASPHPELLHVLAMAKLMLDKPEEATLWVDKALAILPQNANYLNTKGTVLLNLHQYPQAEAYYQQAVTRSHQLDHTFNLGYVQFGQNKYSEAIGTFSQVLARQPDHANALRNITIAHSLSYRWEETVVWANKWQQVQPSAFEAYFYRGYAYEQMGQLEAAGQDYQHANQLTPTQYDIVLALARIAILTADFRASLQYAQQAMTLQPTAAGAYYIAGVAALQSNAVSQAASYFDKSMQLDPQYEKPYLGKGCLALLTRDYDTALTYFRNSLAINPDFLDAKLSLATTLLQLQQFSQAWPYYSARKQAPRFQAVMPVAELASYPQWRGEPETDLWVWCEQGVGDHVFFAGWLQAAFATQAALVYQCDPRLVAPLQRTYPKITVTASATPEAAQAHKWVAAGDLMGELLHTTADLGAYRAQLQPCPNKLMQCRARYRERFGERHLVGLSWHTDNKTDGHLRSIALAQFAPLLALDGIQVISLQYGNLAPHLQQLPASLRGRLYIDPEVEPWGDLDHLIAQIAVMDTVISIDNSTAHFAGALGLPTELLLMLEADWRWFTASEYAAWYPTVRLHRQSQYANWEAPLAEVFASMQTCTQA